jgi:hypothetical protein
MTNSLENIGFQGCLPFILRGLSDTNVQKVAENPKLYLLLQSPYLFLN